MNGSRLGSGGRRWLLTLTLLVAGSSQARAQDPGDVRVGITYTPGFRPGLVMTSLSGESGEDGEDGEDEVEALVSRVDSIVRGDLDFSDRFEIVSVPDSMPVEGPINYGLWNQLGAVWLVTGEVAGSDAAPLLRLTLHDVVFGEVKEVKAFPLPDPTDSDFRMAVHRASDDVVRWATGDPGISATRISFRRKLRGGGSDIFSIDSDGANLKRLTRDSSIVYSPAFSPEGTHLLYVSYRSGNPVVYELNLLTGSVRTISAEVGLNITPAYSADGLHVIVARSVGEHTELFRLQRDPLCCGQRLTFTSAGDALNPSFSPDGRRMAATATPLGLPHIYIMSADGGNPALISRYVFGERGYAASPDWAPTGDRIAYHTWVEDSFQITTVGPGGSDRRILTARGSNEDPSWAPDGRHLIFSSSRDGRHALWILDTVSGRLRSLTTNQVDQMPDWSNPL